MRGKIQSLSSKGLLHPSAWAFPKTLGWLLLCQCTSAQGVLTQSLPSSAKTTLAGEKQEERKEHAAIPGQLSRAFFEEGVPNRNFPLAWPEACFCSHWCNWEGLYYLWYLSQTVGFCDAQKLSDPFNIGKSTQWWHHSLQLSLRRKMFNHKETFNVGRAGKSNRQMKLDAKILPLPLDLHQEQKLEKV